MEVIRSENNKTRRSTENGIVAEQECKRIEKSDPDSLRSDPNMENWKETSRNKDIDGKRRRDGWRSKSEENGREGNGWE